MPVDAAQIDPALIGTDLRLAAYAKVNLTLHVTGQRADGYHLLDSLVVRADIHDTLAVSAHGRLQLTVDGPEAAGVPVDARNLVSRAALWLDRGMGRGAALHLTKRLPHAAGIGGGSADAAAALKLLGAHWGLALQGDFAAVLGADVPVCLLDVPQRMQGIGEQLTRWEGVPPLWLVLVNPRVEVPTGQVFDALESKLNAPMPAVVPRCGTAQELATWLGSQRNDLEVPARNMVVAVEDCLAALSQDAMLARMSGSGATCFGLYDTARAARAAATRLRRAEPDWWVQDAAVLG